MLYNYTSIVFNIVILITKAINKVEMEVIQLARGRKAKFDSIEALRKHEREYSKKYHQAHREERLEYMKKYYQANKNKAKNKEQLILAPTGLEA